MTRQLALDVGLPDLASFDNFHAGSNAQAVDGLYETATGRSGVLFLHGAAASGKSHLLYAAVKAAEAHGRRAFYVSRAAVEPGRGDWLELPGNGLTCIDDLGGGLSAAEARAMFSLYERIRSAGGSLVVSARLPPPAVDWGLDDLGSRMGGDLVYHLATLTDSGLEAALRLRARQRGMHVSDDVVRYVLTRYERSPASLFRLLDRIDLESLAHKRRVTVPFLRALELELQGAGRPRSGA